MVDKQKHRQHSTGPRDTEFTSVSMPMNQERVRQMWQGLSPQEGSKRAITPQRHENFPEWYQKVIKAADLAEVSAVRGCMVIKPNGYGLWEQIRDKFDPMLKEMGVKNAAFPMFIPLEYFQREAQHAEGFATEVAVVTHRRLEKNPDGLLEPSAKLEEPLIVRPTSEMIIGDSMARWTQSYRDLPLKLNQWCSVVRMEMRPRLFLRSTEFWWHEGHSAHASEKEAMESTEQMFGVYEHFARDILALPIIPGEKIPSERFAGAEKTFTIEAMMQDGKALQAATSHYLGQNFAKAMDIEFRNRQGESEHAYTTSWGMSTRMIGALIMVHGDDDGLRIPPRIAPTQVTILPVIPKADQSEMVLKYAEEVRQSLREISYHDERVRVDIDSRDIRGGQKNWAAIKQGIPVRVEIGPREIENDTVVVRRRDFGHNQKIEMPLNEFIDLLPSLLDDVQAHYLQQGEERLRNNIRDDITTLEELKEFAKSSNPDFPSIKGGWVRAKWCEDESTLEALAEAKFTIRCIPLEQSGTEGRCLISGKPASLDVIYAKAY